MGFEAISSCGGITVDHLAIINGQCALKFCYDHGSEVLSASQTYLAGIDL